MTLTGIGELMTAIGLGGVLWGEAGHGRTVRAVMKPLASAGFLVAAIGFGALESRYGQIVFAGLVLGAIGDVCLLGNSRPAFLSGLVAFLLGHVAYVVAFGMLPIDPPYALGAAVGVTALLVAVGRWVFPHAPKMKGPIAVYMVVIGAMVITAVGAFGAGAPWMVAVGAILFAFSDISVVRQRFVAPGFINRAWGLPMYYAAQLLIAWSIGAVAGA